MDIENQWSGALTSTKDSALADIWRNGSLCSVAAGTKGASEQSAASGVRPPRHVGPHRRATAGPRTGRSSPIAEPGARGHWIPTALFWVTDLAVRLSEPGAGGRTICAATIRATEFILKGICFYGEAMSPSDVEPVAHPGDRDLARYRPQGAPHYSSRISCPPAPGAESKPQHAARHPLP
jgi:hypothetical protein